MYFLKNQLACGTSQLSWKPYYLSIRISYYNISSRYLCIFDYFKPTLTGFIGDLSLIELGLFETSDIGIYLTLRSFLVSAVSHGDVFCYLLRFFVRIMIGVSRISYLHVSVYEYSYLQKRNSLEQEEEKKGDSEVGETEPEPIQPEDDAKWLSNWSLTKLFFYNHFPKLLLTVVVFISFVEEDVMSYILYILFLVC